MRTTSRRKRREQYQRHERRNRIIYGIIGGIVLLAIVAMVTVLPSPNQRLRADFEPTTLSIGEQVYVQQCAVCHGINLEGQLNWREGNADGTFRAPPHDETGHTWHHGDSYLLERIRTGTATMSPDMQAASNMPGYEGILTDEEMQAVLAYIKEAWPTDIQRSQARATAAEPTQ
ncbi:MAG: cytochrome c [Anaerolineae bacterium]|nr:cytochrome c [Anaerolineae bacterium]MCO5191064.1 cytochrome c [Anaerolineae bacterium]MCO5196052.1 cytochrome c [Anaerolineae bacterium]MCO5199610.1 cytochrome c [Anaerolineae bacterium]MCO5206486.1 cytochrome c [Anaerolineae bacterium]